MYEKVSFNERKREEKRRCLFLILSVSLLCGILCFGLTGCKKSTSKNLTKVRLNEVAHSIFYAPQYVAMEMGYFEEEGIDLELNTGFGADKTTTAVISGEADIAFMGPEATIYLYQEGCEDYLVNFAQLTQRAGNFVVSRQPMENFAWEDLKGKEVIGGRPGGMPEMVLEYVLKKHNMDPHKDINLVQNIDFANTAGAFAGGTGDYTVEFEPSASLLEEQGAGYVVASVGMESGYVPYTAYSATKSFIEENEELLEHFVVAIEKGQEYCDTHSVKEIAQVIAPQFVDTDLALIEKIVERYDSCDSYKKDIVFEKESFTLLQSILEEAGELKERVPYEVLVDDRFF